MSVIDLEDLDGLCPGLLAESAGPLAVRAAVALERRHAPGVRLHASVQGGAETHELLWRRLPSGVAPNESELRVTEEGAEAIALALAARHFQ